MVSMTRGRWIEIARIVVTRLIHLGPDILVFVNSVKLLKVRIKGA